ncbi:hypothetical protein NE237_028801 [Protea cynaroides]|uniref:Uncharacterized protein n=1 Tax=Protea cynaroides TaxID=273540 RepID=A0A9Q0GUJ0_9MAGN|nr:hypothetical protein NE237_028801 [Protea cynaroides]
MAEKPVKGSNYPLEFWMSRGYPMGPYLRGLYMSAYIREHIKPKELQWIPDEFTFDGEVEFLERTMVRNWVQSWLKYLYWYHTTAWNDEATLEELFQPPVVEVHWKARDVNSQEFRTFGVFLFIGLRFSMFFCKNAFEKSVIYHHRPKYLSLSKKIYFFIYIYI